MTMCTPFSEDSYDWVCGHVSCLDQSITDGLSAKSINKWVLEECIEKNYVDYLKRLVELKLTDEETLLEALIVTSDYERYDISEYLLFHLSLKMLKRNNMWPLRLALIRNQVPLLELLWAKGLTDLTQVTDAILTASQLGYQSIQFCVSHGLSQHEFMHVIEHAVMYDNDEMIKIIVGDAIAHRDLVVLGRSMIDRSSGKVRAFFESLHTITGTRSDGLVVDSVLFVDSVEKALNKFNYRKCPICNSEITGVHDCGVYVVTIN